MRNRPEDRLLTTAYLVSAASACVLVGLMPGSFLYRFVKCLPLLLLCLARLRDGTGRFSRLVGLGLFASLVGDLVIDSVFVAGLGAFLVAHLCYLGAMGAPARASDAGLPALPALVMGGFMWGILVGTGRAPEALSIPITAYAVVISLMLGRAIGRATIEPKDQQSRVFCVGAFLFVVSDSLIGIHHWVFPLRAGGVWILVTYYLGQLLIFSGSLPALAKRGDTP